jgi:hypothetical protein
VQDYVLAGAAAAASLALVPEFQAQGKVEWRFSPGTARRDKQHVNQ